MTINKNPTEMEMVTALPPNRPSSLLPTITASSNTPQTHPPTLIRRPYGDLFGSPGPTVQYQHHTQHHQHHQHNTQTTTTTTPPQTPHTNTTTHQINPLHINPPYLPTIDIHYQHSTSTLDINPYTPPLTLSSPHTPLSPPCQRY